MKYTKTILLTLLLLILFSFTACNMDASSGIFWSIANSKSPLEIRYKQILGVDGVPNLYFLTDEGIEFVDQNKNKTMVMKNKASNIIYEASLINNDDLIYKPNTIPGSATANTIYHIDISAPPYTPTPIALTDAVSPNIKSEFQVQRLLPNSMVLVSGKDNDNKTRFEIFTYTSSSLGFSHKASLVIKEGYSLESIVYQTAKQTDASVPFLISFVKEDERIHYLYINNTFKMIAEDSKIKIASFIHNSSNENIYILSTDGKLFYAGTSDAPIDFVKLQTTSKAYEENAFAYAVIDDDNKYHFITKPALKDSSLQVFSFSIVATTDADIVSLTSIDSGYGKYIHRTKIVSAIENGGNLLVATHLDGMYEITIDNNKANVNGSGTSSEAERYSF